MSSHVSPLARESSPKTIGYSCKQDVGDIEIADEHFDHTPVADEGEDCICLAVPDAPLEFQGLLPKIVQRFARI